MPSKDIALMAHLMRRAGFGASYEELEARAARGYEATVEELLDPDAHGIPEVDLHTFNRYHPLAEAEASTEKSSLTFMYYLLTTQRPLEEKMTLLWHMIFATGNSKVENSRELTGQLDTFRKYGMGSYRELLLRLSKDPAMIFWLDNNENHKTAVNENWGRELLELFSMGQGNYTEDDVREASRAFTGWTIKPKLPKDPFLCLDTWEFLYLPQDHDNGEKTFLGHRGNFNGEDIIDIIVEQPATARFVARHLYNFFVADEIQVPSWKDEEPRDPEAVQAIADAFVNSGYDIRETLRFIFNSDFFKDESAWFAAGEESGRNRGGYGAFNRRIPDNAPGDSGTCAGVRIPGAGADGPAQRGGVALRPGMDRHGGAYPPGELHGGQFERRRHAGHRHDDKSSGAEAFLHAQRSRGRLPGASGLRPAWREHQGRDNEPPPGRPVNHPRLDRGR